MKFVKGTEKKLSVSTLLSLIVVPLHCARLPHLDQPLHYLLAVYMFKPGFHIVQCKLDYLNRPHLI